MPGRHASGRRGSRQLFGGRLFCSVGIEAINPSSVSEEREHGINRHIANRKFDGVMRTQIQFASNPTVRSIAFASVFDAKLSDQFVPAPNLLNRMRPSSVFNDLQSWEGAIFRLPSQLC